VSYATAQLAIEAQLELAFAQIALTAFDGGTPSDVVAGEVFDGNVASASHGAQELDGNKLPFVQWPNGPKITPAGEIYAEVFHLPGSTFVDTLGQHGQDVTPGVTQIDLYFALETGNNAAAAAIDTFRASFYAGQWLTNSGQAVLIRSCGPGPARKDGSYYKSIVTIGWEARISR
jgi:hypothetical protein